VPKAIYPHRKTTSVFHDT